MEEKKKDYKNSIELINNNKFYKKKFICQGLVNYADDNDGIILIKNEAIQNALDTIKGVDVIITHDGEEPAGKVVDAYYEPNNAEFIAGFVVWSKEAQDLLDNKNYSISCTYNIDKEECGGLYHNINYDKEASAITFKNIAIVENPRYQEARQYVNSIVDKKETIEESEEEEESEPAKDYNKKMIEIIKTFGDGELRKKRIIDLLNR